jgi:hypothetical protein
VVIKEIGQASILASLSMMKLILPLSVIALTACMPVRITRSPEVNVIVMDVDDKPIESASVSLIIRAYPYGRYIDHLSFVTDKNGEVSFDKDNEWVIQLLVMHGMISYFWDLCVKKDGYSAKLVEHRSKKELSNSVNVVLTGGSGSDCYDENMSRKSYLNWPATL